MSNLIWATTIEAVKQSRGEIRAGGTDLMERLRMGVSAGDVVDIGRLPGLNNIEIEADGSVKIGANVKVDTVANHPHLIEHYPGLAMAAGSLATPQIRWMATMGGVLLQRNRCWYYRNPAFDCFKKGGDSCPARTGDHRLGVVFDLGACVAPHPSTVGMMLLAYEAQVVVDGERRLDVRDLYGDGRHSSHDHTLSPNELLTHVVLPPPVADERAAYFRSISRARAEWPLVEAGVRLVLAADETITMARIVVGGVANIPLRLPKVEAVLVGQPAQTATFVQAAKMATDGVSPLPQTGYKVSLLYGTVLETLERAQQRVWGGEG
jgi:xanthine dehydrogenase YagS FAD-binding subunit